MIDFLLGLTRLRPHRPFDKPTVCLSVTGGSRPVTGAYVGTVQLAPHDAEALADLYEGRVSGTVGCHAGHLKATYLPPHCGAAWEPDLPARMTLHFFPAGEADIVTPGEHAALAEVEDLGANMDVVAHALRHVPDAHGTTPWITENSGGISLHVGQVHLSLNLPDISVREIQLTWLAQTMLDLAGDSNADVGELRPGCGVAALPNGRVLAFDRVTFTDSGRCVPGPVVFRPGDLDPLFAARMGHWTLEAFLLLQTSMRGRHSISLDDEPVPEWLNLNRTAAEAVVAEPEEELEQPF